MRVLLSAVLALGLTAQAVQGAAVFKITEVFTGLSGEDGTVDWIEVTNFGDAAGDTSSLIYDDSNPSVANAGTLDSFLLAPGEAAVFLISDDNQASDDITYPTAIAEFQAIWGATISVGLTNGGGNLGQGADDANIGYANGASNFAIIDTLAYGSGGQLETTEDPSGVGTPSLSVLGERGAYESASFFNDNLSLPGNSATLVGSPGVGVPEPTTLALAAFSVMGVLGVRRRK